MNLDRLERKTRRHLARLAPLTLLLVALSTATISAAAVQGPSSPPISEETSDAQMTTGGADETDRTLLFELLDDGRIRYNNGSIVDPVTGDTEFPQNLNRAGPGAEALRIVGTRTATRCIYALPQLTIDPRSEAESVEMHEISRSISDCIVEYVVRRNLVEHSGNEDELFASGGTFTNLGNEQDELILEPASGLYRIHTRFRLWWEDIVQLAVSEVNVHMRVRADGSCVSNATGWATQDWAFTGWSEVSFDHDWTYNGCEEARTDLEAEHHNHTFCWPKNIHTHYPEAFAFVRKDHIIGGGNVNASHVSHHGWTWLPCPPLSRHAQLHLEEYTRIS